VTAGLAALRRRDTGDAAERTNRAVIVRGGPCADEGVRLGAAGAHRPVPIVLYMVMHNLERIAASLMLAGFPAQRPPR